MVSSLGRPMDGPPGCGAFIGLQRRSFIVAACVRQKCGKSSAAAGCRALPGRVRSDQATRMDFHILGPLEALDEGRVVTPRGSKQRALLALLLVHANEPLSTDRLIDELWGERPPATAAKNVQVHISTLRKALAGGVDGHSNGPIVTRGQSYELNVGPDELDSQRFGRLVADGGSELEQGRPERAVEALERALLQWRGPALADVAYEPFAAIEVARLDDMRIGALEQLIEAKLELARHEEVVPQLQALVREHPYRERLAAQLMLALYRCDRQAGALQA